jgi:hypothetical protein
MGGRKSRGLGNDLLAAGARIACALLLTNPT